MVSQDCDKERKRAVINYRNGSMVGRGYFSLELF